MELQFIGGVRMDGDILDGDDISEDVSGITCIDRDKCIVLSDETLYVQSARYSEGGPLSIQVNEDPIYMTYTGKELDLEATSNDGRYFYVVGSHGLARKKQVKQASRYRFFRFELDSRGKIKRSSKIELSLYKILQSHSELTPYLDIKLQDNGLNIEGLACLGGSIFIGLRAPSIDGHAVVLEINKGEFVRYSSNVHSKIHKLPLGMGKGIRDLAAYNEGLFILVGDAGPKDSVIFSSTKETSFAYWNTDSKNVSWIPYNSVKTQSQIFGNSKPEGIEVIKGAENDTLVVVSDSCDNGCPVSFKIKK
jgi:hypothetical protein